MANVIILLPTEATDYIIILLYLNNQLYLLCWWYWRYNQYLFHAVYRYPVYINHVCLLVTASQMVYTPEETEEAVSSSVATQTSSSSISLKDQDTQTATNDQLRSIDKFDDEACHLYTGLGTIAKFYMVLSTLGGARFRLQYYQCVKPTLSIPDQFLLTLIKLRTHPSHAELAINFKITEKMVANIFITWINFMYRQWREVDWWSEQNVVRFYSPDSFKRSYPNTRCIVDGTECPVKKPGNPTGQQVTWSSYKNRNTVKVLVGIAPSGLVTYVSDAYGGSASDRQITEQSNLPMRFDPSDELMVDKGFNCEDLFIPHHVTLVQPKFFSKKSRLSNETVKGDRKVAAQRVHVERIIGLAKTYRILTTPLNHAELPLSSEIISVCFWLCNFRPTIM